MSTAVRFDASGDYLRKTTGLLDYNAAYTFCFWVYLASNTGSGYQALLTLSGGGSAYDELFIDGSRVLSLEVGNGASTKVTGATLALSTWYHVTVVRSSTTDIKVYLDGSSTPTITNTQSVSGRIAIGNLSFATNAFSEWADCRAAYARAWTAALSTAELAAEKNSATAVKASPWGVWSLQTNGTDSSGNSRDLTAGGTLTYSEAGPDLPLVITPAAASVAATAVAPTVTTGGGAVTVTPAAGTAAATAVAPTTILGALTIAPTAASAVATAVAPTTVLGAISIAPTAASVASSAVAPTTVLGALTIVPTAASTVATAVAPTVIAGAAIVPGAASAVATAVAPTVILGASTTTPTAATIAASAVAPTPILGPITITPAAASATASAVAPTVSAGAAITPAAASVASSAVAPTVVLGALTIVPSAASVATSAVAPSVMITVIISAILLTARTRIPNVTARRVLGLTTDDRDFDVRFRGG